MEPRYKNLSPAMDIYSIWTGRLFAIPTKEGLLPEIEK
tara:strand:- start:404 stop:517 length:114 start_codon:yes stop_codon:yes gene_type:complete